jgi:hypothetical protein
MTKKELIERLKQLIEEQRACRGDYDSLYFGVKELIE